MIRFASLGSGSAGNALIVECGRTRLMLDCGMPVREIERRLARIGLAPGDLSGIVVTHEHSDHIDGVLPLAQRFGLKVWMTYGTLRAAVGDALPEVQVTVIDSHAPFAIGEIEVHPYPVPHDAREPVQFLFSDGDVRLGVLTDAGASTPHIVGMLSGCEGLVLECNHDADMLASGPYPGFLKQRIGGPFGHLANHAAAGILEALDRGTLRHIVAAHLSERNNRPELARAALAAVLDCVPDWIGIADQNEGLDWRSLAAL
jgi:phosphoribosyl 1,2-cyclic phosphodiesterase